MLAADEHPGAFLEDELPFAPRPAGPDPGSVPPGDEPWAWFQRWRVPISALFVVLIALAVALAFGAKPDEDPAPAPLGSAPAVGLAPGPAGPVTDATPASPAGPDSDADTADTASPASTATAQLPAPALSPPTAAGPGSATTATSGPSTPPTVPRPASTAAPAVTTAAPSTVAPTTSPTSGRPGPGRSPTTQPPATASTVPGYATGSTQRRGPNEPPFIVNPGQVQSTVGQPVRYQIGVSARPGERLTFSATGLPRGLAIDPATGLVTGTPERAETTGVQVTAAAGPGSAFTQGFTWVVTR